MAACSPLMLSVLQGLALHPDGASTPELVEYCGASPQPRAAAVRRCRSTMLRLEYRGLVWRAGYAGPAVVWRLTGRGRAVADGPVPARPGSRSARAGGVRRVTRREEALAAIAGVRRAGYGPRTPYRQQIAWCHALRAAGCSTGQIGDLFGVRKWAISERIAKHPAEVERRDVRLGAAGSVTVIVSILQPSTLPDEKLALIRKLIGEIEALADCCADRASGTPDGHRFPAGPNACAGSATPSETAHLV